MSDTTTSPTGPAHRAHPQATGEAECLRSEARRRFEHSELLAHHFSQSAEPQRALPYLAAAGDRAKDMYANEEAIAAYRQAIGMIESLDEGHRPGIYGDICESLGVVLVRISRYDDAIDAYQRALTVASDPFERAHLHILCSEAEDGAHRYPEALAQCDLAEQALGPAPDEPGPQWLSSWFEVQDERMGILYWLNDAEEYSQLIERVRPFVEAHGSARQRKSFLLSLVGWSLRRDRYLPNDETVNFARAAYVIAQADPSSSRWAVFNFAFTLLFHEDLNEAIAMLLESLREAEQCGDAALRSRSLTYLMVARRKRGDVDAVRKAIGPVIERAREAAFPEYEAMALANHAWVEWRMGEEENATTDAQAALDMWEGLPVRYFFDWMALWPLIAMAVTSGRIEQAVQHARGMLPPPQQLLREPARTLLEDAVREWEAGQPAETAELIRRAVRAAGGLGYL